MYMSFRYFVFLIAFSVVTCFSNDGESKQQVLNVDESFEQSFVKAMNSSYVTLEDNKVIFYAKPSNETILGLSVLTGMGLFFGGAFCVLSKQGYDLHARHVERMRRMPHHGDFYDNDDLSTFMSIFCGGMGVGGIALGVYGGYNLSDLLIKNFSKIQYLVLDHDGIKVFNKPKIFWKDVDNAKVITYELGEGNMLKFKGKYQNDILKVRERGMKAFLPVTLESFRVLVDYYMANKS